MGDPGAPDRLPPVPPGEILEKEFLQPIGLTQAQLAERTEIDPQTVADLVDGKVAIDDDIAERLASLFGTTVEFWTNLQDRYNTAQTNASK